MLKLEVTGTSPLTTGSILVGVYENKPLCVKLPFMGMQPPGGGTLPPGATPPPGGTTVPTTTTMVYDLVVTPATMAEIFESCKYVYRGKMSQLSVLSENLISTNDPLYSNKIAYLRKSPRAAIRAGFTSPITASPSYGALSLEMENFELDPDVVVDFETSFGRIVQFDLRVDGYVQCEIYAKFVASAGAALPIIEGTLLPHQEIPFFIGPVPGTWAREVNATWNISINADVEVKAGTKMRVDFRSGVNYFNETGWGGQLLWKIRNTPLLEAKLTGTFSNEAAIEMKNAVKVGGLAGPELTLKPYIKSEAKVSSEKPCEVNAALTVGLQGELKAIVQAWSYNIGEWGSSFEPFGPWTIASATVSANATPTLHLTGPYNLENQLKLYWPDQLINKMVPHVVTTGTESFVLSMDDSKGLYRGISKVEVSVDGNPAFLTFNYDQLESDSNPELATLTLEFPVIITDKLKSIQENSEYVGWYTPFRLNPGPHELEFKVTDRCGDSSIATHAIWIKAEENPWQVKYNDGVTKAWEVAFTSCERGNLPERTRTIEPESGAFNIAPVFDGTIKNYYESGDLKLEGEFTQGIRTGTWKRNHDPASPQYYTQVTFDSAGSLSKWVYIDLYSQDRDLYFEVNPANGSLDAGVVTTDLSYLDQDLMLTNLVSGERTIGKEGITAGPFHNDTLTNGQRNGPANHKTSLEEASGEYLANLMDEQWTFTNASTNTTSSLTYSENKLSGAFSVTGPDLSITGSFVEDVKTGSWQITNGNESISASYVDGKHDGSYSRTYTLNGALVYYSGSYIAGVSQNTPWKVLRVSDNKQVATITSHIANDTINTASYQPGIPDVTELLNPQLQWSYLFASP
jgi:antitoxin component YwqK of YwqJK toxin-antitoxin module